MNNKKSLMNGAHLFSVNSAKVVKHQGMPKCVIVLKPLHQESEPIFRWFRVGSENLSKFYSILGKEFSESTPDSIVGTVLEGVVGDGKKGFKNLEEVLRVLK